MPAFDDTSASLEIVLGGAVATQLDVCAEYWQYAIVGGARVSKRGRKSLVRTNDTTPVTVVPAPAAGYEHELADFFAVQPNAADVRVLLNCNDGVGLYKMVEFILSEGDNLQGS